MDTRFYSFIGGETGVWSVIKNAPYIGTGIDLVPRLDIVNANVTDLPDGACWLLRGVTSNQRYTTRAEQTALAAIQAGIGRPDATCAAFIPIKKTAEWWTLTQDERRDILETRSAHIAVGLRYLPAVARRLHHSRDLGEPFDFLTLFEYAPSDSNAFEDLVAELRRTEEWKYVEREIDVRMVR